MSLFLNKKIPPNPPLRKGDNYNVLFSKRLDIFPSLAKRGKGRFYKSIKDYFFIPPHPPLTKGGTKGGGFTLIEVLIAVAILSIVLAAIYSTFFLSHRAIEGMDETMLRLQESRRAIDILRRELDSAYYKDKDINTFFKVQDRDVYGKQAVELTFTTFSTLKPGLSKITYYVEDKDRKLNLFKKVESPYSKEKTEGVDIIEDLEAFNIEAKYNDKWVKTWDTEINKEIPHEIRISLTIKIKDKNVTLSDVSNPRFERSI